MTREEMSNQFQTLVNSYKRFKDFDKMELLDSIEFDEYEKSLYLTKAQEELVISLYSGKNPYGDSFEKTEEMRRYLSILIEDDNPAEILNSTRKPLSLDDCHAFYTLPNDLWYITYEAASVTKDVCGGDVTLDIYPVRQDEYHKVRKNPFRGANSRRVLRADLSDGIVELISKYPIKDYYVRYLRRPLPIILEDMPEGVTINSINKATDCELHEGLHQKIVEMAVMMALQSKGINVNNKENKDNN